MIPGLPVGFEVLLNDNTEGSQFYVYYDRIMNVERSTRAGLIDVLERVLGVSRSVGSNIIHYPLTVGVAVTPLRCAHLYALVRNLYVTHYIRGLCSRISTLALLQLPSSSSSSLAKAQTVTGAHWRRT